VLVEVVQQWSLRVLGSSTLQGRDCYAVISDNTAVSVCEVNSDRIVLPKCRAPPIPGLLETPCGRAREKNSIGVCSRKADAVSVILFAGSDEAAVTLVHIHSIDLG